MHVITYGFISSRGPELRCHSACSHGDSSRPHVQLVLGGRLDRAVCFKAGLGECGRAGALSVAGNGLALLCLQQELTTLGATKPSTLILGSTYSE